MNILPFAGASTGYLIQRVIHSLSSFSDSAILLYILKVLKISVAEPFRQPVSMMTSASAVSAAVGAASMLGTLSNFYLQHRVMI